METARKAPRPAPITPSHKHGPGLFFCCRYCLPKVGGQTIELGLTTAAPIICIGNSKQHYQALPPLRLLLRLLRDCIAFGNMNVPHRGDAQGPSFGVPSKGGAPTGHNLLLGSGYIIH